MRIRERMINQVIDNLKKELSQGFKASRELSLVMTKLDEASLWLTRCEVLEIEEDGD